MQHIIKNKNKGRYQCPICLNEYVDQQSRAVSQPCQHEFCFRCIEKWLRQSKQCPVCKRQLDSIIYNVKSETEYAQRHISAYDYSRPINDGAGSSTAAHHRPPSHYHQRLLRRLRATAGSPRSHNPQPPTITQHPPHNAQRPTPATAHPPVTTPPPATTHPPPTRPSSPKHQPAPQLAVRPRATGPEWRKELYRTNQWSEPLKNVDYAAMYQMSKASLSLRLHPWLDREIAALQSKRAQPLLKSYILSLINLFDLTTPFTARTQVASTHRSDAGRAATPARGFRSPVDALRPYFGDKALQFWHELRCFALQPFAMNVYDQIVTVKEGRREVHGEGARDGARDGGSGIGVDGGREGGMHGGFDLEGVVGRRSDNNWQADGVNGSRGGSGGTSASGASGANGASGARGASGTSGARGASGANGASGARGAGGTSGVSGACGARGASGAGGASDARVDPPPPRLKRHKSRWDSEDRPGNRMGRALVETGGGGCSQDSGLNKEREWQGGKKRAKVGADGVGREIDLQQGDREKHRSYRDHGSYREDLSYHDQLVNGREQQRSQRALQTTKVRYGSSSSGKQRGGQSSSTTSGTTKSSASGSTSAGANRSQSTCTSGRTRDTSSDCVLRNDRGIELVRPCNVRSYRQGQKYTGDTQQQNSQKQQVSQDQHVNQDQQVSQDQYLSQKQQVSQDWHVSQMDQSGKSHDATQCQSKHERLHKLHSNQTINQGNNKRNRLSAFSRLTFNGEQGINLRNSAAKLMRADVEKDHGQQLTNVGHSRYHAHQDKNQQDGQRRGWVQSERYREGVQSQQTRVGRQQSSGQQGSLDEWDRWQMD